MRVVCSLALVLIFCGQSAWAKAGFVFKLCKRRKNEFHFFKNGYSSPELRSKCSVSAKSLAKRHRARDPKGKCSVAFPVRGIWEFH